MMYFTQKDKVKNDKWIVMMDNSKDSTINFLILGIKIGILFVDVLKRKGDVFVY